MRWLRQARGKAIRATKEGEAVKAAKEKEEIGLFFYGQNLSFRVRG
jgi:hypothetical protein